MTHIENKQIESGGLLLGYAHKDTFHIKEVIFSVDTKKTTKYDFVLDVNEALDKYNYIKNKYNPFLDVIGFWHCHLTECVTLSKKDIKEFISLSKEFEYSMITILVNTVPYVCVKVFYFDESETLKELKWQLCE